MALSLLHKGCRKLNNFTHHLINSSKIEMHYGSDSVCKCFLFVKNIVCSIWADFSVLLTKGTQQLLGSERMVLMVFSSSQRLYFCVHCLSGSSWTPGSTGWDQSSRTCSAHSRSRYGLGIRWTDEILLGNWHCRAQTRPHTPHLHWFLFFHWPRKE